MSNLIAPRSMPNGPEFRFAGRGARQRPVQRSEVFAKRCPMLGVSPPSRSPAPITRQNEDTKYGEKDRHEHERTEPGRDSPSSKAGRERCHHCANYDGKRYRQKKCVGKLQRRKRKQQKNADDRDLDRAAPKSLPTGDGCRPNEIEPKSGAGGEATSSWEGPTLGPLRRRNQDRWPLNRTAPAASVEPIARPS